MISVIIPTYKSPDMLDLCLQSAVGGQKNQNQIIVVVDGHYDVNEHVLNKWCHTIEILDLGMNVGLCKGTNLGVMNAKHDKVLIVNDDNVFPKDWDVILEEEWELYQELNKKVVISPNQIEPYPSMFKQFIHKDLGKTVEEFDLDTFWKQEPLTRLKYSSGQETGSTLPIFMKKIDYLRLGGWDENYELGMVADWDFFLKCQLSGLKMIRSYSCNFYHFASASTNGEARQKAEAAGHAYAQYKWGKPIMHEPNTNKKYLF